MIVGVAGMVIMMMMMKMVMGMVMRRRFTKLITIKLLSYRNHHKDGDHHNVYNDDDHFGTCSASHHS